MQRKYRISVWTAVLSTALGVTGPVAAAIADDGDWTVTTPTTPPAAPAAATTTAPPAPQAEAATPMPEPPNPTHPQGWPNGWTVPASTPAPVVKTSSVPVEPTWTPRPKAAAAPARATVPAASTSRPAQTRKTTAPVHTTAAKPAAAKPTATRKTIPHAAVVKTSSGRVVVSGGRRWKVKRGQTLSLVGARTGVPISVLVRDNRIRNRDLVYTGQVLKIRGA